MREWFIRLLLLPFSFIFGHNKYFHAKKLEEDGKYKEACYAYAVVILNGGVINEKKIRNKIKRLWVQHGPFDYEEDLKEEISEHGDTPEGCAVAGHTAVTTIIKESIES